MFTNIPWMLYGATGRTGTLIAEQASAVDMPNQKPAALWLKLLEAENALITDGLHIVGRPMSASARADYLDLLPPMDAAERARIAYRTLLPLTT